MYSFTCFSIELLVSCTHFFVKVFGISPTGITRRPSPGADLEELLTKRCFKTLSRCHLITAGLDALGTKDKQQRSISNSYSCSYLVVSEESSSNHGQASKKVHWSQIFHPTEHNPCDTVLAVGYGVYFVLRVAQEDYLLIVGLVCIINTCNILVSQVPKISLPLKYCDEKHLFDFIKEALTRHIWVLRLKRSCCHIHCCLQWKALFKHGFPGSPSKLSSTCSHLKMLMMHPRDIQSIHLAGILRFIQLSAACCPQIALIFKSSWSVETH